MSDDITQTDAGKRDNYDALLNLLYPETIYRFNQAMVSLWKDRNLGYLNANDRDQVAWFVAPYFSAHTRTFHWINIHSSLWADDEEAEKVTDTVLQALSEFSDDELAAFFDQLPRGSFPHETRKMINEAIRSKRLTSDPINVKRGLLALYSGHHNPADWNIEGVFVRLLVKNGWEENSDDNPDLDCLRGVLFGTGEVFSWFKPTQSKCTSGALKQWEHCGDPEKSTDVDPTTNVVGNDEKRRSVEVTLYEKLLGERDKFQEELRKHPSACLIPLYDHWRSGKGYGGIKAVLTVFLEDGNRDEWLKEKFPVLAHGLAAVSSEIANSAQTMAISQPIEAPYDLMHHFLRVLAFVQDWESATVIDESTKKVLYGYRREQESGSVKWSWAPRAVGEVELLSTEATKTDSIEQDDGKYFMWWTADLWSSDYVPGLGDDELSRFGRLQIRFEFPKASRIPGKEPLKRWLRQAYIRQQLGLLQQLIHKVRTRRAALRSALSAIMGRNMSHNIGSHVLARYSSKVKEDRDPVAERKADHRGDFLAYLQRRMDFLAEVATSDKAFWSQPLSLREQLARLNYGEQKKRFGDHQDCGHRRHCTHHLSPNGHKWGKGSPILLSFITGKESLLASVEYGKPERCDATCNGVISVSASTNSERWDYSADSGNNWHQGSGTSFVLAQGRYAAGSILVKRTDIDGTVSTQSVNDAAITVYNSNHFPEKQGDHWFACPGGEVGVHALYIILENIIRNSARHGSSSDDTVRLFVRIEDEPDNTELLTVEIIDPRTKLDSDGSPLVANGSSPPERKYSAEKINDEIKRLGAKRSLIEDGKRQHLLRLPAEINSILEGEPFLDANGGPNPHYWGVREVQICAHYLRGNPLSDLEGKLDETYPVLEADCYNLPDGSSCLMYRLYLQRAKLMAAVVKPGDETWNDADLRRKGILLTYAGANTTPDWKAMATKTAGFSFLALDQGIPVPTECAVLPLRTIQYVRLKEIINQALSDDGIGWLESLHRQWAEKYRDKRDAWRNKPIWGVAVLGDVLHGPATGLMPSRQDGLFSVPRSNPDGNTNFPLPADNGYGEWLAKLEAEIIAATWIDHPNDGHFGPRSASIQQAIANPACGVRRKVWISAEGVFSDSPHAVYLNSPPDNGWELLAAAIPRVAVLDERVQSEYDEGELRGIKLGSIAWPAMGVWVPKKKKCNLDRPDLDECREFLKHPADREDQYPIDFLILHLTVLERLGKALEQSLDKALLGLTSETRANDAIIIIVTGRGVPSVASSVEDHLVHVRYLPISALLESLVTRPSKLALMRAIWSAGRPKSNH